MAAHLSPSSDGSRVPFEEDAWGDPACPADDAEDPSRRGSAPIRFLIFAGLMALAALGIAATWRDRPPVPEMPHRFSTHATAWRNTALDPATGRLFGADLLGGLDRLDLRTGRVERWGRPGPAVLALALAPGGGTLATGGADGSVLLLDSATGAERSRLIPPGPAAPAVTSLAFRPDGAVLAVGSADGLIRFVDPADGRTLHSTTGHDGAVSHLAFGPLGRSLVSASTDGTVRLGDGATGRTGWPVLAAGVAIRHLALAPDGRMLALSLSPTPSKLEGKLVLLDLEAPGAPVRVLANATHDDVAFTPDGRSLIAAGYNSTVREWDVAGGRLVATGQGHQGFINRVVITPDGRQAITSGEDRLLGLFDLRHANAAS